MFTEHLGMDFKQLISQPVEQIGTATQLLEHPWIACKGTDCRVAGAQPNEHYVAWVDEAGVAVQYLVAYAANSTDFALINIQQ